MPSVAMVADLLIESRITSRIKKKKKNHTSDPGRSKVKFLGAIFTGYILLISSREQSSLITKGECWITDGGLLNSGIRH